MNEMHKGICGIQLGSRSMTTQVLRIGYYWPTMRKNYVEYVKESRECQKFGNIYHLPIKELHNIVAHDPLPFGE